MTEQLNFQLDSYIEDPIKKKKITETIEWLEGKGYMIMNITNTAVFFLDRRMSRGVLPFCVILNGGE
jgi:hypothetical protein